MIDTAKLRGIMAERGTTGEALAKELGIHPQTFYNKMKEGRFNSNEMSKMVEVLDIKDPLAVFFMDWS